MEIANSQITSRTLEKPAVNKLRGDNTLERKKLRLKKATREFESFFILHMLKAMRATIPESGLLEGGPGKDIYTSIFDEELSKRIAGNSSQSIGEILYKNLEKHITATSESTDGSAVKIDTKLTEEMRSSDQSRLKYDRNKITPKTEVITPPKKTEQFQSIRPKIRKDAILAQYGRTIENSSRRYDVDPKLIYAVIMVESGGKSNAVSSKGAKGLMQLTDDTAADMGVADSLNPDQNIAGGAKYLSQLLKKYEGDLKLTLAAYNAGPGNVSKYNGVPPFDETRRYIEKVLGQLYNPIRPSTNKTLG